MTEQEQNIAIAEACGWVWYRLPCKPWKDGAVYRCLFLPAVLEANGVPDGYSKADGTERICNWEYMKREGLVPDYVHDLNAIHEAVNTLKNGAQYREWSSHLLAITSRPYNATAPQRAEAFLRTLNLWREACQD